MKNFKRSLILVLTLIIMCTLSLTSFAGCKDKNDNNTPVESTQNSENDNGGSSDDGEGDLNTNSAHPKFTLGTMLNDVMMGKFGGKINYNSNQESFDAEFVISPVQKDGIIAGIAVKQSILRENNIKENMEVGIYVDELTNGYRYQKGTGTSDNIAISPDGSSYTEIDNDHIEFSKGNMLNDVAPANTDADKLINEIVKWGKEDFLPLVTPFANYLEKHFESNVDNLFNQLFIVEENPDEYILTLNVEAIKNIVLTIMNEKASDVVDTMFGKDSFKNIKSFVIDLMGKDIGTILKELKENGLDVLAVVKSVDRLLVKVTKNESMTLGALIATIIGQTEPLDIEASLKAIETTTVGDILKNAMELPPETNIIDTVSSYIDTIGNMYLRGTIFGDTSIDPSVKPEPITKEQLDEMIADNLPLEFKGTFKIIANKNRVVQGISFKATAKQYDDPNDKNLINFSIDISDNYKPENNFLLTKTNTSSIYEKFENFKDKLDPMYKVKYDEINKIVNVIKETENYKMYVKLPEVLEINRIESVCGGYKATLNSIPLGYVEAPFNDAPTYYDYYMALIYNEKTGKITINDMRAQSGFISPDYDGHNYVCDESKRIIEGEGCEKKVYDVYKCSECGAEKHIITKLGHVGEKHYNISYIDQNRVKIETICENCHRSIETITMDASTDYMEYRYKIKNQKAADYHGKNGYAVIRFAADGTCYAQQSYQAALTNHYQINGIDYNGNNIYVCNDNNCDFVITHNFVYGRPESLVVCFYENGVLQDTFTYSDHVTIVTPKP